MKLQYLILTIVLMFFMTFSAEAASFNVTSSVKNIKPNGTFTISIGGDCIGRVNISVSNGTTSTTSLWVEENYQKVTIKAGSSGTVKVTVTPVKGFSDNLANLYNPGSRSVSVSVVNNQSKPDPVKKSNNNRLASLTIDGVKLDFKESVNEYSIKLPDNISSINIKASPSHDKAKISGIGQINVKPGNNTISIVVTAEDGSINTYKIKAYLDDMPNVYFNYKDYKVGAVRNLDNADIPIGFSEKLYNYEDKKVSLFTNGKVTVLYGVKDNSNDFYLFDEENGKIISKLTQVKISNRTFFLLDNEKENMDFINIDSKDILGYKLADNYYLLSLMSLDGNIVDYLYETSEGTLQLYPKFLTICDNLKSNNIIIYILSSLLLVSIVVFSYFIMKLKGGKKDEKVK